MEDLLTDSVALVRKEIPINVKKVDVAQAHRPDHPEHFMGKVLMQSLVSDEESEEIEVLAVFFENGARTLPHVHSTDQLLIVLAGTCVVINMEEQRQMEAKESVLIRGLEWHMHGAAPGASACHLSIRKRGSSNWRMPAIDDGMTSAPRATNNH